MKFYLKRKAKIQSNFPKLRTTVVEYKRLEDEVSKLQSEVLLAEQNQNAIDSLLHEAKQINGELIRCLNKLDFDDESEVIRDIWAQANLLSIRFKAYDLAVNPNNTLKSERYYIALYRRIHKIYRCLDNAHFKKDVHIALNGNSYLEFEATDIIEVAFFIVIENAIKYASEGSTINIDFSENDNIQTITFRNKALLPNRSEMNRLTDRGFHGSNGRDIIKGDGIGLYNLKVICDNLGIHLDFHQKPFSKKEGLGEFWVIMTFKNCRQTQDI